MGTFDRRDFQLLRHIAAEHDPILSQSRARSDRAWRQYFDTFDRANNFRPIDDVSYDRKCSCRPRGDGLCAWPFSSEPTWGIKTDARERWTCSDAASMIIFAKKR